MNNLFIDGSIDDSLFLDDIPGLLIDGDENLGDVPSKCGCDVKNMNKRYAYDVVDDIFPVNHSAALYTDTNNVNAEQESAAATIGFKNISPMHEDSPIEELSENTGMTHCVGRSGDCGDWLTGPSGIAPYSVSIDEYQFSGDDQAEHLSKMVGTRIRAELATQSVNSRIIEGRLTAVNENFLMIEQPDTGASIAYDMNLFKYFMFLPEAVAQYVNASANYNSKRGNQRHRSRR